MSPKGSCSQRNAFVLATVDSVEVTVVAEIEAIFGDVCFSGTTESADKASQRGH